MHSPVHGLPCGALPSPSQFGLQQHVSVQFARRLKLHSVMGRHHMDVAEQALDRMANSEYRASKPLQQAFSGNKGRSCDSGRIGAMPGLDLQAQIRLSTPA